MKKMRFCLSLDADLGKWLKAEARKRRTTVSAMLNVAVAAVREGDDNQPVDEAARRPTSTPGL